MPDEQPDVGYQTVQLKKGGHESPEEGACVMELASMVGHEPFSDRPESVSPVIREFLRDVNDFLDYRRRQELTEMAAEVVDTKGSDALERERAHMAVTWADRLPGRLRAESRIWVRLNVAFGRYAVAGTYAAGRASQVGSKNDENRHAEAMSLLRSLIDAGVPVSARPQPGPEPVTPARRFARDAESQSAEPARSAG